MLPAPHRMRAATDFERAVRRGRRAGSPRVVVHCAKADPAARADVAGGGAGPARVGFVVSRAVGGSVVRHRVARRLRESVRPLLGALPAGSLVVVRAQPAAAAASVADLGTDLERLLARLGAVEGGVPS